MFRGTSNQVPADPESSLPENPKQQRSKPTARSQALRRGLDILCLFTNTQPEWGITEIAKRIKSPKSIVHRTVKTLEDAGFLRQDSQSQRYSLGFRAYQLGVFAARRLGFTSEIRAILKELAANIDATVYIVVREGNANLVVDSFESSGLIRFHSPLGSRIPWNRGASSKLLCALSPPEEVKLLLKKYGLQRHTEKTIANEDELWKELQLIRRQGYSVSDGEGFDDILGISAPILEPNGNVMAALQTSLSSVGLSETRREQIISAIVNGAKEVSSLLARQSPGSF